jgi:hypothetical protein
MKQELFILHPVQNETVGPPSGLARRSTDSLTCYIEIMSSRSQRHALQGVSSENPSEEVSILADAVGNSSVTLANVMDDFLKIVPDPIIAGGFAMAHYGVVRATVDIDVVAVGNIKKVIKEFEERGYKHESILIPVGHLDLLTKGNKGVDFIHLTNDSFKKSIQHRAVKGLFRKESVRYVSLEDLILLKMLAIRGRDNKMDEADLENLLKMSHDTKYVKQWQVKLTSAPAPI